MNTYNTILFEIKDGIATITLNRPKIQNAYSQTLVEEMLSAVDNVRKDDDIKVLVITGAGRSFCIGADLKGPRPFGSTHPLASVMEMREGLNLLTLSLKRLDKITIASINGIAACGGLTIALACDLRIASDKARFTEASLVNGFLPDEGELYFLPRVVGLEKAFEMILLGEHLTAVEAQRIGLIGRVVPHNQLSKATWELAERIAQGPPISLRVMKRAMIKQLDMDLFNALEDTALGAQIVNTTEDAKEGAKAFFEKRRPVFKGK